MQNTYRTAQRMHGETYEAKVFWPNKKQRLKSNALKIKTILIVGKLRRSMENILKK